MNFKNSTINQHFVSQAEQRLNSINPNVNKNSSRIYSFKVVDRELNKVLLESQNGVKIRYNLSMNDLFSYSFDNENIRSNLENAFGKYETNVMTLTRDLLDKIERKIDVKRELVELLLVKFLNFIRNPFSIKKVLNTLGDITKFQPTDLELLKEYQLIENSSKPHLDDICRDLNVTKDEYIKWLKTIFLVLVKIPNVEINMLEHLIKVLLEDKSQAMAFGIYIYNDDKYKNKVCLSDRSWVQGGSESESDLVMEFNLSSSVILKFASISVISSVPDNVPSSYMEYFNRMPKQIKYYIINDDPDILKYYNLRAVYQCHSRVYCASKKIWGL